MDLQSYPQSVENFYLEVWSKCLTFVTPSSEGTFIDNLLRHAASVQLERYARL